MDFREWYYQNEAFYFPGLKFFQKYILPNTTSTNNPLYNWLNLPDLLQGHPQFSLSSSQSLIDSLKTRLKWSLVQGGIHAALLPVGLLTILDRIDVVNLSLSTISLLINLYAVLNQIDISLRLKKAIDYKKAKSHIKQIEAGLEKETNS